MAIEGKKISELDNTTVLALWAKLGASLVSGYSSYWDGQKLTNSSVFVNAGNIGIGYALGTETSNYKLSVNGTIYSTTSKFSGLTGSGNRLLGVAADGSLTLTVDGYNKSNWDTAYGWGNHSGLYSPLNHNHSSLYEPIISKSNGYLKYNGSSWVFDNSTFLTSINSSQITTALGYTPYDASNDSNLAKLNAGNTFSLTNSFPSIKLTTSAVSGYFWKCNNSDGSGEWSPISASEVYKGTWDASTNTPTLADGVGTAGWWYRVVVGGTVNLGSGNTTFAVGDDASYNGTIWQKRPGSTYTLQAATNSTLGGVMIGSGITVQLDGTISVSTSYLSNSDVRIANWDTAYSWGDHASAGYLLSINSSQVTTALGYTPYNSTNPAGYITTSALSGYATQSWVNTNYDTFPGFGTTSLTACVGNDSRLSDSRPASDVYSWAKAATKPTYTYSEVGAAPSSTVSFPGFGTSHVTAAYGDHNHSGVYELAITKAVGYAKWTGSAWSFVNESYQAADADLTAISALGTSTGVLTCNGAGGWSMTSTANWNTAYSYLGKVNIANSANYGPLSSNYFSFDGSVVLPVIADSLAADNLAPVSSSVVYTALLGKQATLSGTGFVKSTGGTISYDTNTYALLNGSTSQYFQVSQLNYPGTNFFLTKADSGGNYELLYYNGAYSVKMSVDTSGNVNANNFILTSDSRLKENVAPITTSVKDVRFVQFNMIGDDSKRFGVIAQDIETIAPEFVKTDKNGLKSVMYIDLLIAKIDELTKRIEILEHDISTR